MKRITKREAMKRFAKGQVIILCPCKIYPHGPFSMASTIHPSRWIGRAEMLYPNDEPIHRAWETMYNEWAYYNATHETGYYAHYYIEE